MPLLSRRQGTLVTKNSSAGAKAKSLPPTAAAAAAAATTAPADTSVEAGKADVLGEEKCGPAGEPDDPTAGSSSSVHASTVVLEGARGHGMSGSVVDANEGRSLLPKKGLDQEVGTSCKQERPRVESSVEQYQQDRGDGKRGVAATRKQYQNRQGPPSSAHRSAHPQDSPIMTKPHCSFKPPLPSPPPPNVSLVLVEHLTGRHDFNSSLPLCLPSSLLLCPYTLFLSLFMYVCMYTFVYSQKTCLRTLCCKGFTTPVPHWTSCRCLLI